MVRMCLGDFEIKKMEVESKKLTFFVEYLEHSGKLIFNELGFYDLSPFTGTCPNYIWDIFGYSYEEI